MGHTFQLSGPDAHVIGQGILPFTASINHERFTHLLKKHGLDKIEPDVWYPLQNLVDIFNDISEEGEAMFNFVSIGMKVIETAKFPPDLENMSLKDIMQTWNDAYQLNHRGNDCGEILYEDAGERHIIMIHRTPYPDDYEYGVIYGAIRRFLPAGRSFTVYYDEETTSRDNGGEETLIHVTWE